MVSIDKAVLARFSQGGHNFEIYVDPVLAVKLKDSDPNVSVRDVLAANEVYKDARQGDKASETIMQDVFGTSDVEKVAYEIITKGSVQLTTEQRKQMVDEKKRAIIAIIAREAYNPQTKTPHPPQRIETAMDEARVSINPSVKAEDQVEKIVQDLKPLIPISMERLKIEVIVPPEYTGKVYGMLKHHSLEKETWDDNGFLKAIVVIPAGLETDFYDEIQNETKGQAQFNRLNN
ncbi:MAG: ribosome assembly factor SBDS [Candidatus Undinarchaeales archaeon]|nr:ribosome assembly factor SBDS [Candidatus Undinarchaeales archaeon]